MADKIKTACSSAFLKSREINGVVDPESVKYELLCVQDDLLWKGDLESLKAFVETNLQLNGRWSSSRGESMQFSNPEFCIKWHGSTDKKLVILQDNDESQLFKTLQSYANNTDDANHGNEKKSSKQHRASTWSKMAPPRPNQNNWHVRTVTLSLMKFPK